MHHFFQCRKYGEHNYSKSKSKAWIKWKQTRLGGEWAPINEDDDILYYTEKDKSILLLELNQMWTSHTFNEMILDLPVVNTQQKPIEIQTPNLQEELEPERMNTSATQVPDCDLREPESEDSTPETFNVNVKYLEEQREKFTSWDNYPADWTRVPADTFEKIIEGTKDQAVHSEAVRHVYGNMMFLGFPIKKKDLVHVAIEFRDTFPQSFEELGNDGKRLDNGYNRTLRQLCEHANYKRKRRGGLNLALKTPLNKLRKMEARKSGTKNWQPNSYPEGETLETLKEKQEQLKSCNITSPIDMSSDENASLIKVTYTAQRYFINGFFDPPPLQNIESEWPCLLVKECLFWHFDELTKCSIDKLSTSLEEKMKIILLFGLEKLQLEYENSRIQAVNRNPKSSYYISGQNLIK